ncbi:ThuA domain-containing protein [Phragmitibacter flavus]|uniref:ThuA domain-containing protein n=1 Tax=Phragmitibacter flavus TaxID=2576071 RepID=A0A5R8KHK9_9BACT|nr:ThuA domain-containing protein [Phragmitibacter flavus]TLD71798.1 ThuA domain-containing protein [Phragmitibacter flavus]
MKNSPASLLRLLCLPLVCVGLAAAPAVDLKNLRPDSTEAIGGKFADKKAEGTLRVLIVGAGSSHNFPKYFIGTDSETLNAQPGLETAATLNAAEALALLPSADVLVFSGNDGSFGSLTFQKALNEFADAGKGIVLVHAAAWSHPWTGYNQRFVAGASRGHGYGEFEVTVKQAEHPVMQGVPASFKITDESYHHEFLPGAQVEILAENAPDDKTRKPHASVWVVKDPKTRIVCITHGHAEEAHANPAYQTILTNAVRWVAGR